MKNEILIYGAGNNAKKLWGKESVSKQELSQIFEQAVAFLDKDENKQGTIFMGKPVLSIEDGLKLYPNAYIYISIWFSENSYKQIFDELTSKGISRSRFINCRLTCDYLEKFIVCGYHEIAFGGKVGEDSGTHSLKPCCSDYGKNQVDYVEVHSDLRESFDGYLKLRSSLLEKIKEGHMCCCTGCPQLRYTSEVISNEFEYVIFNEIGKCNCMCTYCNYEDRLGRDVSEDIDVLELYALLKEHGYNDKKGIIELCNGEITIHPDKKRIYDGLTDTNIMFLTNGLVYDEEITRRMKEGTGILNISIDSGTKETFKRIKGIDGFERVVSHLTKYSAEKRGKIFLKYIFIPGVNDREDDVVGFIELCKKIDVDVAHISYNLVQSFEDYNIPSMIVAIKKMVALLEEENISYEIYSKDILEKLLNG